MNNFIEREFSAVLTVEIEKLEHLEYCLESTENRIQSLLDERALNLITGERFTDKMRYLNNRVNTYLRRLNEQDERINEIEKLQK